MSQLNRLSLFVMICMMLLAWIALVLIVYFTYGAYIAGFLWYSFILALTIAMLIVILERDE